MSKSLQEHVISRAEIKAAQDAEIEQQDKITVAFATVQEFERTVLSTDEDGLLKTLEMAMDEKFFGWSLSNIREQNPDLPIIEKEFPFNVGDIIPWWDELDHMRNRKT